MNQIHIFCLNRLKYFSEFKRNILDSVRSENDVLILQFCAVLFFIFNFLSVITFRDSKNALIFNNGGD